ncbi:hypothetical protein [Lacisediminihabitans sp. H27-G8]|uniref:hypothetical protein n=1 Tax=Lacisediminihabitans sp. H27-G8 TaxID=3111909 RepID=UPI0038FC3784
MDDDELPDLDNMTEAEKSDWAMSVLDSSPPNLVRQEILDRGVIEPALDLLRKRAYSDDPEIRADARRAIAESSLGLLLSEDPNDEGTTP